MKNKIIPILLIAIGFLLIISPFVLHFINNSMQKNIINQYSEKVNSNDQIKDEEKLKTVNEYNKTLEKENHIDVSMQEKQQNSTLQSGFKSGEMIGYITINKINVKLPIYEGTSKEVLQKGVGHVESSSIPIGGEGTHAVLAGHTGLASKEIFDKIDKLVEGDIFSINVLANELEYRVDNIQIVEPDDTDAVTIEGDKDLVTLVTCTPPKLNTYRLLVTGKRVEYEKDKKNKEQSETAVDDNNTLHINEKNKEIDYNTINKTVGSEKFSFEKVFIITVLMIISIIFILLLIYFITRK